MTLCCNDSWCGGILHIDRLLDSLVVELSHTKDVKKWYLFLNQPLLYSLYTVLIVLSNS